MTPDVVRVATKQLKLLHAKLASIDETVCDLDETEDDLVCTLEEHRDRVVEVKTELTTLRASLLASDVFTDNPIVEDQDKVDNTGKNSRFPTHFLSRKSIGKLLSSLLVENMIG